MINNPRILVIAHEQYLNGASHSLITILEGLKARYEFLVIVPDNGMMVDELNRIQLNYEILNLPRCGYFNYSSLRNHLKLTINYYRSKREFDKKLLLIAQRFLPDLVYTNTSVLSFGYHLSKKIKKPHVWHIREYGDKDFNISYIPSRYAIINKIKDSAVSIFTTHLLREHWLGSKKINSEVIYNGVLEYNIDHAKEKKSDLVTIGIVGIIMTAKNQDFALQVFKECFKENKNLRLNIYGTISNQNYYLTLNEIIESNNLSDYISFFGYVPNTEIYKEIDILMSCSKDEAFGRTLIEAMSHKIPVLARNSGGPSEILNDNYELSLYNTLNEAIIKVNNLINDPDVYKKSSEAGYKLAMDYFAKDTYIQSIASVFNKLI
ncbi:glycosyltransferase family 4 protein [Flavobacterium sp. KACC 22761]|uniref:glycosyltransferase family 4 protein n=1 Tax=Flavobacterium sp. KACC 22761 TaxID=3092665 RepID=UPI002A7637E9|nr:glycosyltransferase family 4 protein [Flavobacterium sp. KACC 22761]WPO79503.1 glycosyltransferase family 4 protein [Flavobacterium sp. KACC 22761]